MRKSSKISVAVILLVLSLVGTVSCAKYLTKAPRTGKVTEIVHDARACYDQSEKTVLVQYRPAGTDKAGDPWPLTMFCATPDRVQNLVVGGPVTE